jgi:hypothetical protein
VAKFEFVRGAICCQVSLSKDASEDVLLLCQLYFMNKEYSRALHVMEARGLCSSDNSDDVVFRVLTAQCLVSARSRCALS